MDFFFYPAKV